MPPYQESALASYWDSYPAPADEQAIELRVDSPLEKAGTTIQRTGTNDQAIHPLDKPPQHGPPSAALPVRQDTATRKAGKQQELRFFNVTDPRELKDRSQLRLNRKHVMHTFLEKEREKPLGQRDVRVDGAGAAIKRKRSRIQMPDIPFTSGRNTRDPRSDCEQGGLLTPSGSCCAPTGRENQTAGKEYDEPKRARAAIQNSEQDSQLVKGINRTWEGSRYIQTSWEDIPFHTTTIGANKSNVDPNTTVGAALNPFNTWPAFSTSDIDVSRLKWSCSQRFGSEGITWYYVPELLRARHAFLSTICISSAHDDIMSRASKPDPPDWLSTREGIERLRVRSEVIGLVNQSLADPELRVADATIISVLHLLNSEVMGCDDRVMKTHQDGLHRMVRQRGGLEGLGVKGQLARILTITMYMIAVLRESPPHGEFVSYASQHNRQVAPTGIRIPESPIYSHISGFQTITQESCPSNETWDLLNILRELTTHFLLYHGRPMGRNETHDQEHLVLLDTLHAKIAALPPSNDPTVTFPDLHSRSVYESLRLTALLYSQALVARIPFSLASKCLADPSSMPIAQGNSTSEPQHLQLRRALLQTDMSSLWGPLVGVLFFIALVGGAGANPGPLAQEERVGSVEDGRKFLAAVAVRCSIVLSFEHGGVVLEMLRRFVAIEGILNGRGDKGEAIRAPDTLNYLSWTSEPGTGTFVDGVETAGSERPPLAEQWKQQRSMIADGWTQMADFAWDFQGLG